MNFEARDVDLPAGKHEGINYLRDGADLLHPDASPLYADTNEGYRRRSW